jgi:hypothetical protein
LQSHKRQQQVRGGGPSSPSARRWKAAPCGRGRRAVRTVLMQKISGCTR